MSHVKIRITQATDGIVPQLLWYANRIGEVFCVCERAPKYSDGVMVVKDGLCPRGWVSHKDYETVEKRF